MKRRAFLTIVVTTVPAQRIAFAQPSGRIYRIAYVGVQLFDPRIFRERLAEHGYVEGKNLAFRVFGPTAATPEAVTSAARDAIAWNADVIRVGFTKNVRAVAALTSTVPIVFDNVNDPVASGLVRSLAHPGGNLTGMAIMNAELTSKRLELLRELLPRAKRVALVLDSAGSPVTADAMQEIDANARRTGLSLEVFDPSREPRHTVGAWESVGKARPDAVVSVLTSIDERDYAALGLREGTALLTTADLQADFQSANRIPVLGGTTIGLERGMLAMLGGTPEEQLRVMADQTAKVLSGKPVRDIPVQQFTRIEVGINLKAAKELGITVPQSVLLRADRVIQ